MTNPTAPRIITVPVLAGAYKGKRANLAITLTHSFDANGSKEIAICKQRNVCDEHSVSESDAALPPSCPRCLARDPRFKK